MPAAKDAKDPYSILGIAKDADRDTIQHAYRRLAKLYHPDLHPYDLNAPAKFHEIQEAYEALTDPKKPSVDSPSPKSSPIVVGKWVIDKLFVAGDIADLYFANNTDWKTTDNHIIKVVRDNANNDLMETEYRAVDKLQKDKRSDNFKKYIPTLLDKSFKVDGRHTNVFSYVAGTMSLSEIVGFFPNGVDFRDIVWMGNRALSAIGYAHRNDIVHGAVTPDHLVYNVEKHSHLLVDWCYSSNGDPIKAIVSKHKAIYPPEVLRKQRPTPAVDIYMLMQCLNAAARSNVPKRFKSLIEWCLAASPNARPSDAWDVQSRWVKTAEEEYGPAKFHKMVIPIS